MMDTETVIKLLTDMRNRQSGFHTRPDKLRRMVEAIMAGGSVRTVMREAGVAKATADLMTRRVKLVLAVANAGPIFCPCGEQAGHRGWCSVRYAKSPARQAVMRKLHRPTAATSPAGAR